MSLNNVSGLWKTSRVARLKIDSPLCIGFMAFTYQGRLNTTNGLANGRFDFTFAVFDTATGGVTGSGTITNVAVSVSNGLFTTTLDFGNGPEGAPAWLEIGVASNGSAAFTTLTPRQPITRWNFKQEAGTPHIGPMAQDFHTAFGTGLDDRHIATVDADGVALAAIQGLNQKLEQQTAAARRKDAEITDLKTRLEKLEQLMNLKAGAAR